MRKWFLLICFVFGVSALASAEGTNPYDFESLTVSTTAVGLSSSKYDLTNADPNLRTRKVQCAVETAAVRYRLDGTAPTSSVGEILYANDRLILTQPKEISQVRFIRKDSSDATLRCTYWR